MPPRNESTQESGRDPVYLAPENYARRDDTGRAVLKGNRCSACGRTYFPARKLCPICFDRGEMAPAELKGPGRIYASTVVRIPAPVGIAAPYAYGYVELENDVRVFALFDGPDPEWFQPGRRVRPVEGVVRRDEQGRAVLGYKFRPLEGEDADG